MSIDDIPQNIKEKSISPRELVLPYEEAVQAVEFFTINNIKILAWEGWILFSDGSMGHSPTHQGTMYINNEDVASANNFALKTIYL